MRTGIKHEHYEVLNLLGYGLAKFGLPFVRSLGFKTKTAFYSRLVALGVADTTSVIKNRQDLFDPFFDNGRKGWWQKGDAYIHRKKLIDSLFDEFDATTYADVVRLALSNFGGGFPQTNDVNPLLQTRYKKMQETGMEAEFYFMQNYSDIAVFNGGILDDARLFGDGYDFQVRTNGGIYLAEVKGVRAISGDIRLTEREHQQAADYKMKFALVIVSNLSDCPNMTSVFDPLSKITFNCTISSVSQTCYVTNKWSIAV
jgi:hypothetical protein